LGLAFVHVELLQPGNSFGVLEICLKETAPALRTVTRVHAKINFLTIKETPFFGEKARWINEVFLMNWCFCHFSL